jgi:hypothetical protein
MKKHLASQVDAVRDRLAPDIWYWDGRGYVLRREIYEQILRLLGDMFAQFGGWRGLVRRVCVVGSLTTLQYHEYTDFDLNIEVDKREFARRFGLECGGRDLYGCMMRRLYEWLEGVPVEGTLRTFSLHVYFYPWVLASDNIYVIDLSGRGGGYWMRGMNLVPWWFDPDKAFSEIKLRVDALKRVFSSLLSAGCGDARVVAYFKVLEWFFKEWRHRRFELANRGRGHYLAYRFSSDWDSGNIAVKYLGEWAKPYKLLIKKDSR